MNEPWYVIYNPISGNGKGREYWGKLEKLLAQAAIPHKAAASEYPLHSVGLAKKAVENGYRKIIAIGGDGTVHEVANGILQQSAISPKEVALGAIPTGRGNDWAINLGMIGTPGEIIGLLQREKTFLQDVGLIRQQEDTRYFISMIGVGFDGFVAKKVADRKRAGLHISKLAYFVELAKGLFAYRHRPMSYEIDGKTYHKPVFTAAIGIMPTNGGGMRQAPGARPDDGLFDITVIKDISKWEVLMQLKNLYSGTFVKHPKVEQHQGRKVSFSAESAIQMEADGEPLAPGDFSVEIIPNALKVITGK